jgi:GAF domain-containing protein
VLALSNRPQQLIEMVLDELLHLLKVDYGWVQLVGPEDRNLRLVASSGGTVEMTQLAGWTDSHAKLGRQVVVGSKVVVPDLSRNSKDGLASFALAGFRSLVVVPIRTYHTHGVIGVASRTKNHLDTEVGELLMTIAGLVGTTLNVAELGSIALDREKQRLTEGHLKTEPDIDEYSPRGASTTGPGLPTSGDNGTEHPTEAGTRKQGSREANVGDNGAFGDHSRSMDAFRKSHGKG